MTKPKVDLFTAIRNKEIVVSSLRNQKKLLLNWRRQEKVMKRNQLV